MLTIIMRLDFEMVYPKEKRLPPLDYLYQVNYPVLRQTIGFLNTKININFDNFFTNNPTVQLDVIRRVSRFIAKNAPNLKKEEMPQLFSREGSLKLAELILANEDSLKDNQQNKDKSELNLFKCMLSINSELRDRQNSTIEGEGIKKIIDLILISSFSNADFEYFNDNEKFGKVAFATLNKLIYLIGFLKSNEEYQYLIDAICEYYNVETEDEFLLNSKNLIAFLFIVKFNNNFRIDFNKSEEDEKQKEFLNALISTKIEVEDDFIFLRQNPIYKINDKVYSVIDYFFLLDAFSKGLKFILKKAYNQHFNLKDNDRSFFNFFNNKFSEDYLMKRILDSIFEKPYFIKANLASEQGRPDYYVRYNNTIFLFENKDIFINKKHRVSGDIEIINKVLKEKLAGNNKKSPGIKQLVNSIEAIQNKTWLFDEYVNQKQKNNIKIYPIIILTNRDLQVHGLNAKLNNWFFEILKTHKIKNVNLIKPLTIIDIETLIYWQTFIENDFNKIKRILDMHTNAMKKAVDLETMQRNKEINRKVLESRIKNILLPIGDRNIGYRFNPERLIEVVKDALSE